MDVPQYYSIAYYISEVNPIRSDYRTPSRSRKNADDRAAQPEPALQARLEQNVSRRVQILFCASLTSRYDAMLTVYFGFFTVTTFRLEVT